METHSNEFSIKSMARILNVSRSGYYKFLKEYKEEIEKYDKDILIKLERIWLNSRKTYGVIRLLKSIKKIDTKYGARRVRRMMKFLEIKGKQDKKFRVMTTNSNHKEMVSKDLVRREFNPDRKNQIWASDVTYVKTHEGWLYLCIVMDLFSRRIVSWRVSNENDTKLITSSIQDAINKRNPSAGLIFHSDRGSNYCSIGVQNLLLNNNILRSNSRKGNCWDNAVVESFFGSLKRELEYNIFYDLNDVETALFDYIEIFYNRQRMHSHLGYMSPQEFEDIAV